jgi:hypothetical protein
MNNQLATDIQWDVVGKLYSRLQRLTPGTQEAEAIDHAITLALNPERQAQNVSFLVYDVLRNARYSRQRTQKRCGDLSKKLNAYATQTAAHINCKTPEAICIAQEIEAEIRQTLAQGDSHMMRCFEGMLVGESISETATACGISRRSVDRARQKIRAISRPFFFEQEAG